MGTKVRTGPAGLPGSFLPIGPGCRFTYYLDGVELTMEPGDSIDDFLMPSHLSAIEVYARPPYPAQFAPVSFGLRFCGSIVIWTGFVEGKY